MSCVICYDGFRDEEPPHALACGHIYHADCIKHWHKHSNICPHCNKPVCTKTLIRLFVPELYDSGGSAEKAEALKKREEELKAKEAELEALRKKIKAQETAADRRDWELARAKRTIRKETDKEVHEWKAKHQALKRKFDQITVQGSPAKNAAHSSTSNAARRRSNPKESAVVILSSDEEDGRDDSGGFHEACPRLLST